MKKTLIALFLISYLFLASCIQVEALDNGNVFKSWVVNNKNEIIRTQDAYLAKQIITTIEVENSTIMGFKRPEDIFYESKSQTYYIADTGNKRILKVNNDFSKAYAIGENYLQKPEGLFVSESGIIYVADYDLQRVTTFDLDGNIINKFNKPTHPLYGETMIFRPSKIVVDKIGTMYIVDTGNPNGLVQLTEKGDFMGYFGANYITPSISYIIRFMFSTKAQKNKLYRSPIAPTNMMIDYDGLINTITKGLSGNALKKLNISGHNLFSNSMVDASNFNDITIGTIGNIYTITADGYIYEYDAEGNLLFIFGGNDPIGKYNGLFANPKAITVDEDYHLFIVDHLNNQDIIQVFERTEFAHLVHESIRFYQDGLYEESRIPWSKVLQYNNMFDLAHEGIANAYLRESKYSEAMAHFRLANDIVGYSEAFWEVRNLWLMKNASVLIIIIIGLLILIKVLKSLKFLSIKSFINKGLQYALKFDLFKELIYLFTFIKHPVKGFYEVKRHRKISNLGATFLYIIFYLEIVANNVLTGFIFNPIDVETVSIVKIAFLSLFPLLLAVLCNYLISSITVGNGRLQDVYRGTICSFAPLIIFMPFVILISNVLTLNEIFIYQFLQFMLWGWSFGLLYLMVKETQELSFGETNKNIFITMLTMILFVAFGFLLYILGSQSYNFVKEVIMEVISHG